LWNRTKGPFCYCAASRTKLLRFFPALVRDLLEDIIDLDSTFRPHLKPCCTPGKLTRDYLEGALPLCTADAPVYFFQHGIFILHTLAGNAIDIIGAAEESQRHPPDVRQMMSRNWQCQSA
jgi:hypothetical protein